MVHSLHMCIELTTHAWVFLRAHTHVYAHSVFTQVCCFYIHACLYGNCSWLFTVLKHETCINRK